MRGLVRVILGIAVVVALVVGAVALIPKARVAALAAAEVQRLTGRVLTIGGPVRVSVWPGPGVTVGDVALANADWSGEGPMLVADRLALRLSLAALVRGEVRIIGVEAQGARLVLERSAEGVGNWDFAAGQAGAAPVAGGAAATPFAVAQATIRGGALVWIDHAAGTRLMAGDIALDLQAEEGALAVSARAEVSGQPVTLTATAGDPGAALAGQVVALQATVTAGGASVAFDGRAGRSPAAAEGRIAVDLADMRALAALTGAAPDLPEGLGARVRQLAGQVTLAPEGTVHLRQGTLTLDGNTLRVAADVTFDGPRPRVSAQLDTGMLAIPGLTVTGGAALPQDAGWPRGIIDVSALGLADAAVALRAEGVTAGAVTLGPLRAMATVDRARAVVSLREVQAWGGTLAGEFVVNGRGGLSVGGDLTATGIAVEPLLSQLAGQDGLTGTGDAALQFLGVGNSVAAIMATLSGEGRLALAQGEVRGLDLPGMLRTLDAGLVGADRVTAFDALAATFVLRDGILRNDDLSLAAPGLALTGAGTVGLGAQVIDYRLTPAGAEGARVPVQVTGPWSAPRLGLDLRALAEQELAAERARVAQALAARAEDTVGIAPGSGESGGGAVPPDGAGEAVQGVPD